MKIGIKLITIFFIYFIIIQGIQNKIYAKNKKEYYKNLLITIIETSKLLKIEPSLLLGLITQESKFNPYALNLRFYSRYDYLKFKKKFKNIKKICNIYNKKVICSVFPKNINKAKKVLNFIKKRKNIDYDIGLMQINKRKLKDFKIIPEKSINLEINILIGAMILKKCLKKYKNINKALICYNKGEYAKIKKEKNKYSQRITFYYEFFKDIFIEKK